jgi:hypothetical protein
MMTKKIYWILDILHVCLLLLIANACKRIDRDRGTDGNNENKLELVYLEYNQQDIPVKEGIGSDPSNPIIISSDFYNSTITYKLKGDLNKEKAYLFLNGAILTSPVSSSMNLSFTGANQWLGGNKTFYVNWLSSSTEITELIQDGVSIYVKVNNVVNGTEGNPFITKQEITANSKFEITLFNNSLRTAIQVNPTETKNLFTFKAQSNAGTIKYHYLLYKPEVPPVTLNSLIYKGVNPPVEIDITTNHEPAEFSFLTNCFYYENNTGNFDINEVYYTLSNDPTHEIKATLNLTVYPTMYLIKELSGSVPIKAIFYHNLQNPMNLTKLYYKTGIGSSAQIIDIDLTQGDGTQANPYTLKSPSFTYTCSPKPCTTGFLYAELSNPATPPSTWINENNIIDQTNNLYELKIPYGYKDKDYLTKSYYLKWEKTP